VYVQENPENPENPDNEPYQARSIQPRESWQDYVTLIKTPIPDNIVNSWKNLSNAKLAIKYGFTKGIKNFRAIKTLHKRMLEMIERRRKIWNQPTKKPQGLLDLETNYKLMNIFKIRYIAKERNITTSKLSKDVIVQLLNDYDNKSNNEKKIETIINYPPEI
jgi:hypothetical protein